MELNRNRETVKSCLQEVRKDVEFVIKDIKENQRFGNQGKMLGRGFDYRYEFP